MILFKVIGQDSYYLEFKVYNRRMIVLRQRLQPALLLFLFVLTAPLATAQVVESVSTNLVPRATEADLDLGFSLHGQWRFALGDDALWSSPALDDTAWETRRVPGRWSLGGYPDAEQFAWYRLSIALDSGDAGF